MKRILIVMIALFSSLGLYAQEVEYVIDRGFVMDLVHMGSILFVFYLISVFIITIIKLFLDYRLKNKILDKQIPDVLVQSLLNGNTSKEMKNVAMKWLMILTGLALGLTVVSLTPPFGIHSLAIIAFSLAASYLGYFAFIKRSENNRY